VKAIILLLFWLVSFSLCTAQTGVVKGKLILKNTDEEKYLAKKITAVLKSSSQVDSVLVNKDLTYEFENVKSDTINIRVVPHSYPFGIRYTFFVAQGETKYFEMEYSPVCQYSKSMGDRTCPTCKKKNKVLPILYGLIFFQNRREARKYYLGGCVVYDCQPSWFCKRDETMF
jgi:hypothetical protein